MFELSFWKGTITSVLRLAYLNVNKCVRAVGGQKFGSESWYRFLNIIRKQCLVERGQLVLLRKSTFQPQSLFPSIIKLNMLAIEESFTVSCICYNYLLTCWLSFLLQWCFLPFQFFMSLGEWFDLTTEPFLEFFYLWIWRSCILSINFWKSLDKSKAALKVGLGICSIGHPSKEAIEGFVMKS